MNTLFPLPESPSPRLLWLKEHGVHTFYSPNCGDEPWSAFVGTLSDTLREVEKMGEHGRLCYGSTEQEAITRLAIAQGWKLWNMP